VAAVYAVLQDARHDGVRDRTGPRPRGFAQRIESTAAEFAVAKWLGRPIEICFQEGHGDVGELEVRWVTEEHYCLLVRPDDPPEVPYLPVTGRAGLYRLKGWLHGHEAKRPEWLQSPNGRPPVYLAPQSCLHPVDTLAQALDEAVFVQGQLDLGGLG